MFTLILVQVIFGLAARAQEPEITNKLQGFDSYVEQVLKDWNTPGIGVGIVVGDKLVFAKGYGYRDYEKKLQFTPVVAALRLQSAPPQHSLGLRGDAELIVKARTRHLPFPRYAHHAVESSREGRSGAAHGFDLRQAKGRAASMRWIFSRSNSLLMLRSATKDFSR